MTDVELINADQVEEEMERITKLSENGTATAVVLIMEIIMLLERMKASMISMDKALDKGSARILELTKGAEDIRGKVND